MLKFGMHVAPGMFQKLELSFFEILTFLGAQSQNFAIFGFFTDFFSFEAP